LSQTWGFSTEMLKHLNLNRLFSPGWVQYIRAYAKPSNAALIMLCGQLKRWNAERVTQKTATQQPQDLTLEDVNAIRAIIQTALGKVALKHPEIMADQLLFLTVGAIQIQSQTGADKAWGLVNQSIQNYLNTHKEKRMVSVGLFSMALLVCVSMTMMNITKMNTAKRYKNNPGVMQSSPLEAAQSDADPVTMSMLLLAYQKMQSGTCQLPQAAMLPEEQRHAFLLFVNKGIVEVQNVDNLRLALGYVNCLYPQELMRPMIK
jgi:hypothetical protein